MVATQSQSFGISRRALDVEDYIDIARRHVGWIVGPAFAGLVVAIVVAFSLRNSYVSHATMEIRPAQISANMVQSTLSSQLNDRIQQMQNEIMSRTSLGALITDPRLMLYKDELKTTPLEDVIDDMKKDINIGLITLPGSMGRQASAFTIQFSYYDKYKAQQTVATLITKFNEVNQNAEKSQQDMVKGYVDDRLNTAKADLDKADNELTAFKQQNAGKLPEQAQINIAQTNAASAKITADGDQIYRLQQELAQYEVQKQQTLAQADLLDDEASRGDESAPGGTVAQQNGELASINKSIEQQEFNLQQLSKIYSDAYPDIKNGKKQLETYKTKRDQIVQQMKEKEAADAAKPKEPAKKAVDPRYAPLKLQYQQKIQLIETAEAVVNQNIERYKKEQSTYKADSDSYSQRLKDETGLEAPYDELLRAEKNAQAIYQDLLQKKQLAEANSQLIERKAGETLEVLDPASVPAGPSKPNRFEIVGAGFAGSLILGLALAAVQEAKDTSLKNLKDVRAYTNLPVLCSVPLLENTMLVKRKRRLVYLAWSAAAILGATAIAISVAYYQSKMTGTS